LPGGRGGRDRGSSRSGAAHPIQLSYYKDTGPSAKVSLMWQTPFMTTSQVVPKEALFPTGNATSTEQDAAATFVDFDTTANPGEWWTKFGTEGHVFQGVGGPPLPYGLGTGPLAGDYVADQMPLAPRTGYLLLSSANPTQFASFPARAAHFRMSDIGRLRQPGPSLPPSARRRALVSFERVDDEESQLHVLESIAVLSAGRN
jgi:hypothetical protein